MTHDELLSKIDSYLIPTKAHLEEPNFAVNTLQALRAVVELHKPHLIPDWVPTDKELMCWCAHVYPCPTIQAIQEQLR